MRLRASTLSLLMLAACDRAAGTPSPSPNLDATSCQAGTIEDVASDGATHVAAGTEIAYTSIPPCIGDHYGQWLDWGPRDEPPAPGNYVHNLEHGGMVFLYDCAQPCPELVARLQTYLEGIPDDDGGAFRFILGPYPGLPQAVAAVAWGWLLHLDCADLDQIDAFVKAHYRKGPEDISSMGGL